MTFTRRQQRLIQEIYNNLNLLEESLAHLDYSYQKCSSYVDEENHSLEELESIEALMARFARASDIFISKVVKKLLILLREMPKTMVDIERFLEKLDVMVHSDQFLMIQGLRDAIAHSYLIQNPGDLLIQTAQMVDPLKSMIEQVSNYFYLKFQEDS